jgi:hypothetical protein
MARYTVTDFHCDPDFTPEDWTVDEPLYEPLDDEWDEGDEWDAEADTEDCTEDEESENY